VTVPDPVDVEWPDGITAADAPALDELADAGVSEGDFGGYHDVPAGLLELYEVLEWQRAIGERT